MGVLGRRNSDSRGMPVMAYAGQMIICDDGNLAWDSAATLARAGLRALRWLCQNRLSCRQGREP
jgi:hypothetical protein